MTLTLLVLVAVKICAEVVTVGRLNTKNPMSINVAVPSTFAARYVVVLVWMKELTTHVHDHIIYQIKSDSVYHVGQS